MQEKSLQNLVINKVESQEVYDSLSANGKINSDELYLVGGGTSVDSVNGQTGDVNLDIPVVHTVESQEAYDEMVTAGQVNKGELYLVQGEDSVQSNKLTNGNATLEASDSNEYLNFTSSDPGHVELYCQGLFMEAVGPNTDELSRYVGFMDEKGNIVCGLRTDGYGKALKNGTSEYTYYMNNLSLFHMGQNGTGNIHLVAPNGDVQLLAKSSIQLGYIDGQTGEINANAPMIVKDPTEDNHPATKKYVDDKVSDKELILTSSTSGSTKKFKITVDDSGTISATEIN